MPILPIGDVPDLPGRAFSPARPPCPGCGHDPLPDEHFCGMCGADLERPKRRVRPGVPCCQACGAELVTGMRYCVECGVRLKSPRS